MEKVSLVIAGDQLGITVCSLVLGAVGEPAVAHLLEPVLHARACPTSLLHPVAFAIAMSIVVYLHVVLGEMVPKNIALAGPDRAALVLGPPMLGHRHRAPPGDPCINLRRQRHPAPHGGRAQGRGELELHPRGGRGLVEESRGEGLIEADEYDRLAGALGFTEKTVTTVLMPPRP